MNKNPGGIGEANAVGVLDQFFVNVFPIMQTHLATTNKYRPAIPLAFPDCR